MATKEELEILEAKPPDPAKCKQAAIDISAKVVDRIAKGFEDKKEKVPDNLRKKKFLVGSMENYCARISVEPDRCLFQRFRRGEAEPPSFFHSGKKRVREEGVVAQGKAPRTTLDITGSDSGDTSDCDLRICD